MKIKVISDGTKGGTHVADADTGEVLENVFAVEWRINAETLICEGRLEFCQVAADLTFDVPDDQPLSRRLVIGGPRECDACGHMEGVKAFPTGYGWDTWRCPVHQI